MNAMAYVLPWPPSVNRYWRAVGGRAILSREGRQYRVDAQAAVLSTLPRLHIDAGRVELRIMAHAPDNRRRDLDNLLKGVLDALQTAGVYTDDSQVDSLTITRGDVDRGRPRVVVQVREIEPEKRLADGVHAR